MNEEGPPDPTPAVGAGRGGPNANPSDGKAPRSLWTGGLFL